MITSSDPEYLATKLIKQGNAKIAEPLRSLADWIANTWNVNVLNVIYDKRNQIHGPRLQIILEYESDVSVFRTEFSFDENKTTAILAKYSTLVDLRQLNSYDHLGQFVVFSAFRPIAKQEADSQISTIQISSLVDAIANPDIWTISRFYGYVTFLFYTDVQVQKNQSLGMRKLYTEKYFSLLKPFDEFGYLSLDSYSIHFDSKENFDQNYESNWYYYYK